MFPHECLQYPGNTAAYEWDTFWKSTREIVFNIMSGLKHSCPQERQTGQTFAGPMDNAQWFSWVRDVLWVLHQLMQM